MEEARAPVVLIDRAKRNEFHDYKSESATPCIDLVQALTVACRNEPSESPMQKLRRRAMDGEFDSDRAECDEWANSPEGREVIVSLPPKIRKLFE